MVKVGVIWEQTLPKVVQDGGDMQLHTTVADPGFPVGGRGPPTWVLFSKNVCKNERIWSHGGGGGVHPACPP